MVGVAAARLEKMYHDAWSAHFGCWSFGLQEEEQGEEQGESEPAAPSAEQQAAATALPDEESDFEASGWAGVSCSLAVLFLDSPFICAMAALATADCMLDSRPLDEARFSRSGAVWSMHWHLHCADASYIAIPH